MSSYRHGWPRWASRGGDGKVFPSRDYKGSLAEKSQEAVVVFKSGTAEKSAVQEQLLKIQVEGNVDDFAWVIPLPNPPKTGKTDAKLFKEAFDHIQARKYRPNKSEKSGSDGDRNAQTQLKAPAVEVISRDMVGSYDVAVVREKAAPHIDGL